MDQKSELRGLVERWTPGVRIAILCENKDCIHYGDVFNEITGTHGTDGSVELILDSWGQGAESGEDYCPSCGELGVAYDESD